jgi:hypothetical protein
MAKAKKPEPAKVPDMDFEMLDPGVKKALQEKARTLAEKEVQEEMEDAFLLSEKEKAKHEEREKHGLLGKQEEMVTHTINLPPNADKFRINNRIYNQGQTYELPRGTYEMIVDIESKGWQQEAIRKGDQENAFGLRDKRKAGGR